MLSVGVDLGASRLRLAVVTTRAGSSSVEHVVVRDLPAGVSSSGLIAKPDVVGDILADAVAEAGTRKRTCIGTVSDAAATVRAVAFPPMSRRERNKAARYEARRYINYPVENCVVRLVPGAETEGYLLGCAQADALRSRVHALRRAGLRPIAIDHESFAWRRAVPQADCLIDVGLSRSTVTVFTTPVADVRTLSAGGAAITEEIARGLGIDAATAERRKRTLEHRAGSIVEAASFIAGVADVILEARSAGKEIRRIALAGNGARLPGLAAALEGATGVTTSLAQFPSPLGSAYPQDVLRVGAPDWLLAFGAALWKTA